MNKPELVEVLDIHAEGLKAGMDLSPALLAQTPSTDPHLKGLLSLAEQVKSTLVPVEPRSRFVSDLKARLLANASQARRVKAVRQNEQERQVILGAVAGVGGLLYALGLALLGLRMMFAMVSLVVAFFGWLLTHPVISWRHRTR